MTTLGQETLQASCLSITDNVSGRSNKPLAAKREMSPLFIIFMSVPLLKLCRVSESFFSSMSQPLSETNQAAGHHTSDLRILVMYVQDNFQFFHKRIMKDMHSLGALEYLHEINEP